MAHLLSPRIRLLPSYLKRYGYALSSKRIWNFAKVMTSIGISRISRRPIVWGQPFMMMVEPTNFCNLKCPLCPSGNGEMTRARGNMDLDDYRRLIDQVADRLLLLMLWNQGEPFINRCFNDMVRYAHQHRITTMTSTNGHFLRTPEEARDIVESGLDEIIISLDGVDQETYAQYRVGGDIERVLTATRLLVEAKAIMGVSHPLVNLQFIVMRHNEEDVARAEAIAADLGVDKFLVKSAQVYTEADADQYLPSQDDYRRYHRDDGGLQVKGQPPRGCKVLWHSTMVNWNGAVAPCCFDKNLMYPMGDVFGSESFAEIWRNRSYMDFRRRLLTDRENVPICNNCSEGYRGMFSLVKELRG